MKDPYREEIVDPNDRASRLAHEICVSSYKNCPAVEIVPHDPGNFRGPVGFTWKNHVLEQMRYSADCRGKMLSPPAMLQEIQNDGAGGKPQFFTLIGTPEVFYDLGWEIITMNADDLGRSLMFQGIIANDMNVKNITSENFPLFEATMEGYGNALKKSNLVNITGETAIMKNSITAFCDTNDPRQLILTWGATCIGLSHRKLLADNSKIKSGMYVVGLKEKGYRCNGGTFLTKVTQNTWGSCPQEIMENKEALSFVRKLTIPSISYAKTLTRIAGWNPDASIGEPLADIVAAAHITGGGMGKFAEIIPKGVCAYLSDMPKPPEVLLKAQELSWDTDFRLNDTKAHTTFHGGFGMVLVARTEDDARIIIREVKKDGIEAQIAGRTLAATKNDPKLTIESKFKEEETVELN